MKNHYKFWIVFSLFIVFAAGVTGGILFEKYFFDKKPKRTVKKRSSVHFPTLDMMSQELDLTEVQQEQIRDIFKNNEERLRALRSQIHEQYSSVRSQLMNEIKNVLTKEQNQKFEAMIDKYISQRKKELEKRKKTSRKHRKR